MRWTSWRAGCRSLNETESCSIQCPRSRKTGLKQHALLMCVGTVLIEGMLRRPQAVAEGRLRWVAGDGASRDRRLLTMHHLVLNEIARLATSAHLEVT